VRSADASLLARFHYLSTVSGGGYIGSWLSAWRARTPFVAIWSNLVGRPDGPDQESSPIAWLRSHSNYLAPKLGVTSADSWALAAVYLRNLGLNWLVILSVVCGNSAREDRRGGARRPCQSQSCLAAGNFIVLLGALLLVLALSYVNRNRPSRQDAPTSEENPSPRNADRAFLGHSLVWSICSAVALRQYFAIADFSKLPVFYNEAGKFLYSAPAFVGFGALIGAVIYALSWFLGWPSRREPWCTSGLVYGALVAFGYYYYPVPDVTGEKPSALMAIIGSPVVYFIIGVPWILPGS
jgi:hypothetical protein